MLKGILASLFVDGKAPEDITNLQNTLTFRYAKKIPHLKFEDFYLFHENLARFYLELASGDHKEFQVNTDKIVDGSVLTVTEEADGQVAEHRYTVSIDVVESHIRWTSPVSKVQVRKWGLSVEVTSLFEFVLETGKLTSVRTIALGSEKDKSTARREGADRIWARHARREMTNLFLIFDYLVESKQIRKDATTWNIDEIRAQLL